MLSAPPGGRSPHSPATIAPDREHAAGGGEQQSQQRPFLRPADLQAARPHPDLQGPSTRNVVAASTADARGRARHTAHAHLAVESPA